jgi:hypothetical protein
MAESGLQENVLANGGKLESGPITRNLATGWVSPCAMSRCVFGAGLVSADLPLCDKEPLIGREAVNEF